MWVPVATVIENLEDLSIEEVMGQFDVTREQVAAVLAFGGKPLAGGVFPARAVPAPPNAPTGTRSERDEARARTRPRSGLRAQ